MSEQHHEKSHAQRVEEQIQCNPEEAIPLAFARQDTPRSQRSENREIPQEAGATEQVRDDVILFPVQS